MSEVSQVFRSSLCLWCVHNIKMFLDFKLNVFYRTTIQSKNELIRKKEEKKTFMLQLIFLCHVIFVFLLFLGMGNVC